MITYPCGCKNEIHQPSGILHSVSKCADHRRQARDPATLGRDYYASIGLLTEDDQLAETDHVAQLVEALGPIPLSHPSGRRLSMAMEIGGGVSPYCQSILNSDYFYFGLEPSSWACEFMCNKFGFNIGLDSRPNHSYSRGVMINERLGEFNFEPEMRLCLAAHCIEHMEDAPGAIQNCADMLESGGQLWMIVPDDQDPVNPDHLWHFNVRSLVAEIKRVGLVVDLMTTRRYIEREQFIYCRASKL